MAIKVDVTNWDQINDAVKATVDEFGRIDIAINSAGIVVGSQLRLVKVSESPREEDISRKR